MLAGPVASTFGRGRDSAAGWHQGESSFVYAIVRCGGKQSRASVDDVLTVDKLAGEVGSTITLPAVLIVDGAKVISDRMELGGYEVTAEVLGPVSGPKINMIHFKNKTGYRRRQGHRQKYTQVKITGIGVGRASPAKTGTAKTGTAKTAASKARTGKAGASEKTTA